MANRGWRPRSTSTTRRPRLSSASAASDPAKPDPTTATSASMRTRPRDAAHRIPGHAAETDALLEVHRLQPIAPRGETQPALREPLEIPEIDEHPSPVLRMVRASAKLRSMSSRPGARNDPASANASIGAVARPRRHQRHDGSAAGEGRVDGPQQPGVLLVRGMNGGEMSRNTRSATPRSSSALAAARSRSSVNRLFSRSSAAGCAVSRPIATSSCAAGVPGSAMAIERREQPIDARAHERGMGFDDHARQPGERRGHLVVVGLRDRARVEEAAGVVQLHAGDGARLHRARPTRAAATCAGIAPRGVSPTVV